MADPLHLLAAPAGLLLFCMQRRHRRRVRAERAAIFAEVLALFDSYRVVQDDIDFPVLTGHYRGHAVRVQPLLDHIAVRKLPSLWLLVSVYRRLPIRGTFDLLARPQNIEFYSPSARLPVALQAPPGWPRHAAIRTDGIHPLPSEQVIGRHLGFFDDPRAKELTVTPRGVRLVYQAAQANRAHYLVLRQAQFEQLTLAPGIVRELLDRAVALLGDLAREANDDHDHALEEPRLVACAG